MSLITSRQHPIVKACRAIARGDDPRVLLDGWHLLIDAMAAAVPIDTVLVRQATPPGHESAIESARGAGASIVEVSDAVMHAISPVREPSGVVALATRPDVDRRRLLEPPPALVLAGLGLQDPGNVGATIRAADGGGATGVLLDGHSADPWGPKALRASMGSAFRLPVRRDARALDEIVRWHGEGVLIAATDPRQGTDMRDANLTGPLVLVLGAEGGGLPAAVLDRADVRVRIPMRPGVESLNVAVAAALLVYEAARQRSQGSAR